MIINGKNISKMRLSLNNGQLKYVTSYVYLGYTLTDTGLIQKDVDKHIKSKRGNTTVKFMNFCRCNPTSPLSVKFKILDACVNSCYLYGCDVWGNYNCSVIETLHRKALRTALSIRDSVNNEIVYVESGQYPLSCTIQARQLKFWLKMIQFMNNNDESYLSNLIRTARTIHLPYIQYYDGLLDLYGSPENCLRTLQSNIRNKWQTTFTNAQSLDNESKLGVYKTINPNLSPADAKDIPEFERTLITRYRCGSHYLEIEKGRFLRKLRQDRLCICGSIQTLNHVVFDCPLVDRLQATSLHDFFQLDARVVTAFLTNCEKILKIRKL